MRKYVDIPDKTISVLFNASYVSVKSIDREWIMEQLNNCDSVHDYLLGSDPTVVFILKQNADVDIMTKIHLCDAIENILISHTGFKGELSLNFTEAFKRIAHYDECIAIYESKDYSVCYHLKYDDSIDDLCGECLDSYFKALYKFKLRGMKNG